MYAYDSPLRSCMHVDLASIMLGPDCKDESKCHVNGRSTSIPVLPSVSLQLPEMRMWANVRRVAG